MKKSTLLLLFILPLLAIAQPPGPPPGAPPPPPGAPGRPLKMGRKMMADHQNRLQALAVAHLTRVLELTPAEAEKFWPVYNKYNEEVKKAMRDSTKKDILEKQQEVLNIRKKYQKDFQKILSPERAQKIYKVEMEFREMVKKELDERRKLMEERRAPLEKKGKTPRSTRNDLQKPLSEPPASE